MIGTTSVGKARIAIVVGLLIGCAFIALLTAGVLQMMGILPPPARR